MKTFLRRFLPLFLLPVVILPGRAFTAEQATRQEDVGGQYLIRATVGDGDLHRSIFPRARPEVAAETESGQVRKLRLPAELYSEVRTYQKGSGDEAGASYQRAYTRLVEAGECRPLSAGFREASFDCGPAKGRRTVAVRQDSRGTYFSWESQAVDLIQDSTGFDRALRALDDLTDRLLAEVGQEP
jgi:hypothetical protein